MPSLPRFASIFCFCAFAPLSLSAQSFDDWIWYDSPVAPARIYDLKSGQDGALWMAGETKILRFDGNNWLGFDYTDAGISIAPYKSIYDFAFAPDGKIWCSVTSRVLELDPVANTWVLHDPLNGQPNSNAFDIDVHADGRVWWLAFPGFYSNEGGSWNTHHFNFPGVEIVGNNHRQLLIDDEQTSWFVTPSSICFDPPACFTPAGVIEYDGSDTIAHDGAGLGFPDASSIFMVRNKNGKPLLVINPNGGLTMAPKPVLLPFENGTWQAPVEVPFNFYVQAVCSNPQGDVWIAGQDDLIKALVVCRKADGSWQQFDLDPQKIENFTSVYADSTGNFWASGYVPEFVNGTIVYKGALGLLPSSAFKAQGRVFVDANNNGSADAGESGLPHNIVQVNPGPAYVMTNVMGDYTAALPGEGSYTSEAVVPQYCTQTLPAAGGQNFSVTNAAPVAAPIDFGIFPDYDATDVSATLTALNPARPGFTVCYRIDYQNEAPKTADGTVSCTFDSSLLFQSASVVPVSNVNNTLVFNFNGLEWMAAGSIEICFQMPVDAVLGNVLHAFGQIAPSTGTDLDLPDNGFAINQTVVGTFDPNIKEVLPKGVGDDGKIAPETPFLEYTVHFQNTGTDTAFTVILTDSVRTHLDITTFRMLAASHDYRLDLYDNRVLRWTFPDIKLPDSTTNEVRSHGFVKFRIGLNPGLPFGTVLENNADIYFDFNQPVRTNTVVNTISDISGVVLPANAAAPCEWNVAQAGNYLKISGLPVGSLAEIVVMDAQGKVACTGRMGEGTAALWTGNLPAGIYFVSLHGQNLCRETRRIFRN